MSRTSPTISKLALLAVLAFFPSIALAAGISATASYTYDEVSPGVYDYSLTLNNTGTTTIGTFWFSWVPGAGFLSVAPSSVNSPAGWTDTITNSGKAPGDEVVQVYLKFPDVKGAPQIALRGFQRIHLEPGTSQKVHFDLKPRDLGIVTEDGHPIIAQGDYTISIGGGQPETGAPTINGKFHIDGQVDLPE